MLRGGADGFGCQAWKRQIRHDINLIEISVAFAGCLDSSGFERLRTVACFILNLFANIQLPAFLIA